MPPFPPFPAAFWLLLLLNSFLAYFVNLTNFLVTKHTSALTLQVLGNAKGVVAVVISVMCFRNPVTVYSMLGYGITVGGVVLYSHAKKRTSRKAEAARKMGSMGVKQHNSDLEQPLSPFNPQMANGDHHGHERALTVGERQALLSKGSKAEMPKDAAHNRTISAAGSERIMARGFSSIFEA